VSRKKKGKEPNQFSDIYWADVSLEMARNLLMEYAKAIFWLMNQYIENQAIDDVAKATVAKTVSRMIGYPIEVDGINVIFIPWNMLLEGCIVSAQKTDDGTREIYVADSAFDGLTMAIGFPSFIGAFRFGRVIIWKESAAKNAGREIIGISDEVFASAARSRFGDYLQDMQRQDAGEGQAQGSGG